MTKTTLIKICNTLGVIIILLCFAQVAVLYVEISSAISSGNELDMGEYIFHAIIFFLCVVTTSLLIVVRYIIKRISLKLLEYQNKIQEQNKNLEKQVSLRTNEIKEKTEYLESIFENTVNGIIIINKKGVVQNCNNATYRMFGYTKKDLIGKNIRKLMPDRFASGHDKYIQRYLLSDGTDVMGIQRQIAGRHKNGNEIPIEIALSKIDLGGEVFFIGVVQDVSVQYEAQQLIKHSEFKFRSMFENSPIGMALCDMEGNLLEINHGYADIIGYTVEQCLKLTYWDITPKRYVEDEQKQLEDLNKSGRYGPYEKHYIHKDGHEVPVILHGIMVKTYDDKDQIWSFVEDTTARKKAELEVKKYQENLEKMVKEQTADLQVAKEIAEQASITKSEFLSNISHELRTPMHAIISFSRQGIERINIWKPEEQAENLLLILSSAERLKSLVDNLLDLSKLESGNVVYDMSINNIYDITQHSVDVLGSLIEEKNLGVKIINKNVKTKVDFDRNKITQVIINLLSNSIKLSPYGKNIEILLTNKKSKQGDYIVFSIFDEGPGIPEGELGTIFNKFIQSSKTKTGAGGTGLGLSICLEIIRHHHGDIWAENRPNGGANFIFILPVKQPK